MAGICGHLGKLKHTQRNPEYDIKRLLKHTQKNPEYDIKRLLKHTQKNPEYDIKRLTVLGMTLTSNVYKDATLRSTLLNCLPF